MDEEEVEVLIDLLLEKKIKKEIKIKKETVTKRYIINYVF